MKKTKKATPQDVLAQMPMVYIAGDKQTKQEFEKLLAVYAKANGQVFTGRLQAENLFGELLKSGSDEKLMGAIEAFNTPELETILNQCIHHYHGLAQARVVRHIEELDGNWSPLVDRLAPHGSYAYGANLKKLHAKWRKWAKSLDTEEKTNQACSALLGMGSMMTPLAEVARYAPVLNQEFVGHIFKDHDGYSARVNLLRRTDLPAVLLEKKARSDLAAWSKRSQTGMRQYGSPMVVPHVARLSQWQWKGFASDFLDAFEKTYNKTKRGKTDSPETIKARIRDRRNALYIVGIWKGGSTRDWARVYKMLKDNTHNLASVMANPEFPMDIAKKVLAASPTTEVRVAISKNKNIRQDKEVRELLEKGGQNFQVWWSLLESSTDPDEAGRLFSYMASKKPEVAAWIFRRNKLPAGTKVPSMVMARIMAMNGERESRVAIIKALPGIKPVEGPGAPMPARAKARRQ